MLTMLKDWKGTIQIDDKVYSSIQDVPSSIKEQDIIHIVLKSSTSTTTTKSASTPIEEVAKPKEVRITVKKYMTQTSTPNFDFMAKWNNDVPMPFRIMTGIKVKETRGMVYMKLHGDIWQDKMITCMRCGRVLTNPVSRYFGIGPECGNHKYINPFNSEEELRAAVAKYKEELHNITWEGWVIRSAIIEEVEA